MSKYFIVLIVMVCAFLLGCSARFQPAPVETLSTRIASKNNLTEISGETYIVQAGDTLFSIAFYSGNTYRDLAKINDIPAPYAIKIGQTIKLKAITAINTTSKKIDVEQTTHESTKVLVDRSPTQAYGGNRKAMHRKNQNIHSETSAKPYNNRWIWPAAGEHKVATVGTDGINRGLDIKGRLGSQILAAQSGKVVYAGNALKGYGNLVIIKHDDEYLSAYAHNDKILVGEQTYVVQGQQIATMGQSGASEVMLHFEIRKKGKSRDPFLYLPR